MPKGEYNNKEKINMQNKLFAAIMTALLVLAMAGSAMCANEDVTVSIGDGQGTVTIPIMVENVTNLGSCNILLEFDETVVSVTDVTDGDMNTTIPNIHSSEGWVRIVAYTVGNTQLDGDIIVANVTFAQVDPCSNATSDLTLTVTTLKDATPHGHSVPYDIDNGVYTSAYDGDVSGDGIVDIHDAMYIAMNVSGMTNYPIPCPGIADVDCSPGVDIADAHYLANHIAGTSGYEALPCVPEQE